MGGAHITPEIKDIMYTNFDGKSKENGYFEDLGVDEKIILPCLFRT
jgi:hypothetical protein